MINSVSPLIKTLLQIIILRKGPESIPHSNTLFLFVTALWLLVGILAVVLVDTYKPSGLILDVVLAVIGLLLYGFAIRGGGYQERTLRSLTAILGCGAIFSVALFVLRGFLPLIVTESESRTVVELVWLWSVPVEGHIVARAMSKPWFVGFLIAIAVLLVQLQLLYVLHPFTT